MEKSCLKFPFQWNQFRFDSWVQVQLQANVRRKDFLKKYHGPSSTFVPTFYNLISASVTKCFSGNDLIGHLVSKNMTRLEIPIFSLEIKEPTEGVVNINYNHLYDYRRGIAIRIHTMTSICYYFHKTESGKTYFQPFLENTSRYSPRGWLWAVHLRCGILEQQKVNGEKPI